MIVLAPITTDNFEIFKTIRLQALQHDPGSFGSTYARESQFTAAEWAQRLHRWDGSRGIGYLAVDKGAACGVAGCLLDDDDATRAMLVSMWVAPTHRGRGVGRLLVDAVITWAHQRSAHTLHLMVTCNNHAAINFYESLGFVQTDYSEPYPNDPALVEYEMVKAI